MRVSNDGQTIINEPKFEKKIRKKWKIHQNFIMKIFFKTPSARFQFQWLWNTDTITEMAKYIRARIYFDWPKPCSRPLWPIMDGRRNLVKCTKLILIFSISMLKFLPACENIYNYVDKYLLDLRLNFPARFDYL